MSSVMTKAADDASAFAALLVILRSPDNAARAEAEKRYTEARQTEPDRVLAALVACLAPSHEEVLRSQAAILLRRFMIGEAWCKADPNLQTHAKATLLQVHCEQCHQSEAESWPELVPSTFALAKGAGTAAPNPEAALLLLSELMSTLYAEEILTHRLELGSIVSNGLSSQLLAGATIGLVAAMVRALPKADELQAVLPKVEEALKTMALMESSEFVDAMQSLILCAEMQTQFFKPRYRDWLEMMLHFAASRGTLADSRRLLAFEWVATAVESKSKVLLKAAPELPQRALETAFAFLMEVTEDGRWASVDEDEEEDDEAGLHKEGEAKVDLFVKRLGFQVTCTPLSRLVQQHGQGEAWQSRLAAAMAIRASAEYVEDATALDAMATLLLRLSQDEHMRVRYAALFALGQICHEQGAEFHERWHSHLIPGLLQACRDPVERVAAMAIGALEAHIHELEEAELSECAPAVVDVLLSRLRCSSRRRMLVSAMEALGALAAGLEGSFDSYYEQLMPMLLQVVTSAHAHEPEAAKLKGKAFECMSLLGYAVGKEKFAPAAEQTMRAMMASDSVTDEMQKDCMRDAMQRMCKVLGSDFASFLPALLPGILASLSMEAIVSQGNETEEDNGDELTIPTEDGLMKVKTSQITETLAVVSLLQVFVKETGPRFLEFVRPTSQALARILGCADTVLHVASQVRDAVYPCWAELVATVSQAVPTHGQEAHGMVVELVQMFVDKVGHGVSKAEDADDIAPMAQGVASVVANAGEGCLQAAQVKGICDLAADEISKSFQRERVLKESILPLQTDSGEEDEEAASQDNEDDEDDYEDERECRNSLVAIFGACMKTSPGVFFSHSWPSLQILLQEWLGPAGGEGRRVGLRVARDACQHLGEQGHAIWPVFMESVLQALCSTDADERHVAATAIKFAAQAESFRALYALRTFEALALSLRKFKAKKNDEYSQRSLDCVVAALVQLCLSHPVACPDLAECWRACFAHMPLKVELEECRRLHRRLFEEAQRQGSSALGGMAGASQVLGYLCEVHGRSELCDEELQLDISSALAGLPQPAMQDLLSRMNPKQQKKVHKILTWRQDT